MLVKSWPGNIPCSKYSLELVVLVDVGTQLHISGQQEKNKHIPTLHQPVINKPPSSSVTTTGSLQGPTGCKDNGDSGKIVAR